MHIDDPSIDGTKKIYRLAKEFLKEEATVAIPKIPQKRSFIFSRKFHVGVFYVSAISDYFGNFVELLYKAEGVQQISNCTPRTIYESFNLEASPKSLVEECGGYDDTYYYDVEQYLIINDVAYEYDIVTLQMEFQTFTRRIF